MSCTLRTAIAGAVLCCACSGGGDGPGGNCRHDSLDPADLTAPNCKAALEFAARDTPELIPTQDEVDRYLSRWQRAIEAEPILDGRLPQRHRFAFGAPVPIITANPAVIAAWNAGTLATGDAAFDAIIGEIHGTQLAGAGKDNGDGTFTYNLQVTALVNEELLATSLAPTMSTTSDPVIELRDDGTWLWLDAMMGTGSDGDTAQIDFTFGWGACVEICDGFHRVRAQVTDDAATVFDLGGDPLPPDLHLSPNTKPL